MAKLLRNGLTEAARIVGALVVLSGVLWGIISFGDAKVEQYVSKIIDTKKLETIEHVDAVRDDLAAIVADRKALGEKREKQLEAVGKQINDLSLKLEGTNQRISTQIEGLASLVARLNNQLDNLNARLPLRQTGLTIKMQDRVAAESAPMLFPGGMLQGGQP